ncbi:hypothetical protein BC829DRAFT_486327 [Chytridium lagenaria]|nr:hypothetical protein BC829DRAFT_486327 [Chytridium lagenaria]
MNSSSASYNAILEVEPVREMGGRGVWWKERLMAVFEGGLGSDGYGRWIWMFVEFGGLRDGMNAVLETSDAQLEFQSYVLQSAENNLTGNVSQLQRTASATDFDASYPGVSPPMQPGTAPASAAKAGSGAFWTVEYYATWFDVDSEEVGKRMLDAVVPRGGFAERVAANPDLYGPFWIPTTVILSLFVTSSIAGSIFAYLHSAPYNYDLTLLTVAASSVWFGSPVKYFDVVGVYGYSFTIWVPALLICMLPMELARWILIGIAFGLSTFFILQNILPGLSHATNPMARTVAIGVVVVAHAGLALLFRFYFFTFIADVTKVPPPGGASPPAALPSTTGALVF